MNKVKGTAFMLQMSGSDSLSQHFRALNVSTKVIFSRDQYVINKENVCRKAPNSIMTFFSQPHSIFYFLLPSHVIIDYIGFMFVLI